jgi:hypothetical protein
LTTLLGILGLVVFVLAIISLAAAITWVVIRLTMARDRAKADSASQT